MADLASLRDQVVVEWVLTNGKLPGFEARVVESRPAWHALEAPMTVYRAQGGGVTMQAKGSDPAVLMPGVRPVLATSETKESAARYAGPTCCLFEIQLPAGTRVINVTEHLKSHPLSDEVLDKFRSLCVPGTVKWPNPKTGYEYIQKALLDRCEGRVILDKLKPGETVRKIKEIVPPEDEIMVYAVGGSFGAAEDVGDKRGVIATKRVSFIPAPAGGRRRGSRSGRGRTFRRTSRRRDKNGGRPTRKSKHHVRNRHAGNR